MSLKTFHIVFVTMTTILCVGVGVWAIRDYQSAGDIAALALGIGSLLGSLVLAWYGRWFLRKLKNISYL